MPLTPHRITLERAATVTERLTFTAPLDPDEPFNHAEDLVMAGTYPDEPWTPDPESARTTETSVIQIEPVPAAQGGAHSTPGTAPRQAHLIILTRVWEAGTAAAVRWTSGTVDSADTLLPALRAALSSWIRQGGQPSEPDVNIGDLANELGDADLTAALAAQDVHDLTIDTTNMDATPGWEFDTNLAPES